METNNPCSQLHIWFASKWDSKLDINIRFSPALPLQCIVQLVKCMYFILIRILSFFFDSMLITFLLLNHLPSQEPHQKEVLPVLPTVSERLKARVLALIGVLPSFAAGDRLWGGMFCTTAMKNLKGRRVMHCKKCRRQSLPMCQCHRLIFFGWRFQKTPPIRYVNVPTHEYGLPATFLTVWLLHQRLLSCEIIQAR